MKPSITLSTVLLRYRVKRSTGLRPGRSGTGIKIYSVLFAILCVVFLTGFGCRERPGSQEQLDRALVVWGLWQESEQIQPVLDAFEDQTGVAVEYRKIASVADYQRQLLRAIAEGRGPDVFVIHHTWVDDNRGILAAAPTDTIDSRAVQEEFVDVVGKDLIRDGLVYALPTSVDTLGLYYNRDLLNTAGVARPPQTWEDFQRAVEKITRVTRFGTLQQSAAALGTAQNVNRAADVLQLLMLQSGISLVNPETNRADIDNDIGERAVVFYTDFANKSKQVYTWDLQQDFSIDAFAEGDTAMMINYSYHIPTVQAKNPRLNFGIAPMPQITDSTTIDFAAYWPFAVSATSPAPRTSWQFVRFLTSQEASNLINQAQKAPPARRDSVIDFERDPLLGPFAQQTLTATSWPRLDITVTDQIFNTLIDSVVTGAATSKEALRRAEDQLNQPTQANVNP